MAGMYRAVSKAETFHERRYRTLLDRLVNGKLFTRPEPEEWQCTKCCCEINGSDAPIARHACKHPENYFIALVPSW